MAHGGESAGEVRSTARTPSPRGSGGSPRQRRRRLGNLVNLRCGLADCIRALEDETMEPGRARALIYGYSVLAGIIQGTELEERLAKLESSVAAKGGR